MIEYITIYVIIAIAFMLVIAFMNAYSQLPNELDDVIASVFWPVTLMSLFGLLTRLLMQYILTKKDKNEKNKS